MFWSAPPDYFFGDRVFIVGGGPSVADLDTTWLHGLPMIAINNTGLDLFPCADVLYWSDNRWLEWNRTRLDLFRGRYRVTRTRPKLPVSAHVMRHHRNSVVSDVPDVLAGDDSGSSAINLAYLMGAQDIVLLGFDMTSGGAHDYPKPGRDCGEFIAYHERMAPELARRGIMVRNATPGTRLNCYEKVRLEDVV